jgi:glycosyltransferase involved in cell wall biosynthesis
MRIGVAWYPCANAHYRAVEPIKAMARRGHEVVFPSNGNGEVELRRLAACDVVHVFRRCDEESRQHASRLVSGGVSLVYDNDDDFTALPKDAPTYKKLGGLEGQRGFARTLKMARLAGAFTTTTEVLAAKYRRAGVQRVEVIGNYLSPDTLGARRPHDGIVIGWVAGGEHQADANRIKIADALREIVAKHGDVRVECIGVNLALPERYRHDKNVEFVDLPERIRGFDIGIAPLIDIPLNRARSDIKLKEYAAGGVPWLASPVGPYIGLGEREGGRLVPNDQWCDALERLVVGERERERLARNARGWAKTQTVEAVADRWESVFAYAHGREGAEDRDADRAGSKRLALGTAARDEPRPRALPAALSRSRSRWSPGRRGPRGGRSR